MTSEFHQKKPEMDKLFDLKVTTAVHYWNGLELSRLIVDDECLAYDGNYSIITGRMQSKLNEYIGIVPVIMMMIGEVI
jgi:hypothetical protein